MKTGNPDIDQIHASLLGVLGRRFRTVDREDISQELWLAFYNSEWAPNGPVRPVEAPEGAPEWEEYSKALRGLRREMEASAKKYCRAEKAATEGYRLEDEAFYSTKVLRDLLEAWFAHGPAESPAKSYSDSVSRPARTASTGDYLVSLIDVGKAVRAVKPRHRAVLFYAYSPAYAGRTDEEIAAELRSQGWAGLDVDVFTRRVGRAVYEVQKKLGGAR